jgi:hypothetical protein
MQPHMQIIVGKINKLKINNLKTIKKLEVNNEEEFKTRVKQILYL